LCWRRQRCCAAIGLFPERSSGSAHVSRAIDAHGKPLFKPLRTELVLVSWEERHWDQRLLYEAITEYVREGYNQAMREKRSYIRFLMILMQRLVVSSTRAIRTTPWSGVSKRSRPHRNSSHSSHSSTRSTGPTWTARSRWTRCSRPGSRP